jgi:phenylacetate-CoA ligase
LIVDRARAIATTPLEAWIGAKIGCTVAAPSRDEIEEYQLGRLNETLRLAGERSPFYRELLGGSPPPPLRDLAEFARLPFTCAEDLRLHGPSIPCAPRGSTGKVVTLDSSGTSGDPKQVLFTFRDQELTIDYFEVGMSTLVGPGDRVLILLPGERQGSVGDLLASGLRRIGATAIPYGLVRSASETVALMLRERVTSLVGIPVQIRALAESWGDLAAGAKGPRSILLGSDYVPRAVVRGLREAWSCEVFEHYGTTEMGLGGGVECEAHEGYHMREADLLIEIVEPESGTRLPDGERGEVVFTTLTREGMPLIRYRTGDLSRIIPEPCPCGSVLRRLAKIESRMGDAVPIGGDQVLTMPDLDESIFESRGIVDFAASAIREAGTTRLRICALASAQVRAPSVAELKASIRRIDALKAAEEAGALAFELSIYFCGDRVGSRGEKRVIRRSTAAPDS